MRKWTCALVILTIAILAGACATAPTSPAPNATPVAAVAPAAASTQSTPSATATQAPAAATAQAETQYPDGIPRINVDEAVRELKAGTAIIVDVRTKEQWAAGHVKGAQFIPENELAGRTAELPHDKKIIAYCS
jgi:hypothetical protein